MQTRQLGSSPVQVTPIVFGAWAIGGWMWGGNDEADSLDAIRAALDNGITTIDTAAVYGMGYSEELVGKALQGRRDKAIIATKCGMRWDSPEGSDPWPQKDLAGRDVIIRRNSKPDSIAYECEQSLKRLQTDVIDLLQIHWPDTTTPIEDSIYALDKLRQQGKIRAFGVCNYNLQQLRTAHQTAPLASLQPPYSLINRAIEPELLPFCQQNNIGLLVYSPLERGLLTGAVPPSRKFPPGDHRAAHKYFTPENRQRIQSALAQIQPIADRHHANLAQLIINWTAHQPGITAPLVGARNAQQSTHNAQALSFTLTPEERSQIRAAFTPLSQLLNA